MANFTVTIIVPDEKQIDLRDTICSALGYQDTINGQPNPQTKAQFLNVQAADHLKIWLKNTYKTEKERLLAIASAASNTIDLT